MNGERVVLVVDPVERPPDADPCGLNHRVRDPTTLSQIESLRVAALSNHEVRQFDYGPDVLAEP